MLGVPFDNVTMPEALERIEQMVSSGQPHYLVTANIDFLAQAREDVELRRILFDAHLVLCDGTPLVWASRLLGNPLPERVAGADLVPLLIELAAEKGYRVFFLGAAPESLRLAVAKLKQQYSGLQIAGAYSPPFHPLLDMDHEEIRRRIIAARPHLLFVGFGCPKQEKWMAMHYRSLGVPVAVGVGGTIDFLSGQMRRAPRWMQRTGCEWLFRLAQEPRRLYRRYGKDLWVFGRAFLPQWWQLQLRRRRTIKEPPSQALFDPVEPGACCVLTPPARLEMAAFRQISEMIELALRDGRDCILRMDEISFIDSSGVGLLIRLQKLLRASGRRLVLAASSQSVQRALALLKLQGFFTSAGTVSAAAELLHHLGDGQGGANGQPHAGLDGAVAWHGEVTAANAANVWEQTQARLTGAGTCWTIDMSRVQFIDSSGLGVMVRAKKYAKAQNCSLVFAGIQAPVRNVLRIACLEEFLGCAAETRPTPATLAA